MGMDRAISNALKDEEREGKVEIIRGMTKW